MRPLPSRCWRSPNGRQESRSRWPSGSAPLFAAAVRRVHHDSASLPVLRADQVAARCFPDGPLTIVPLALALATLLQSAEDAILMAANIGGDSDSVASIAGGILGAMYPATVNQQWCAVVESINRHGVAAVADELAALRRRYSQPRYRMPPDHRLQPAPAGAMEPHETDDSAVDACERSSAGGQTPSIQDVAWLQGCWERRDGDRVVEERWTPPRAGSMLGVGRTTRGEKLVEHEFVLLTEREGRLAHQAPPVSVRPRPRSFRGLLRWKSASRIRPTISRSASATGRRSRANCWPGSRGPRAGAPAASSSHTEACPASHPSCRPTPYMLFGSKRSLSSAYSLALWTSS